MKIIWIYSPYFREPLPEVICPSDIDNYNLQLSYNLQLWFLNQDYETLFVNDVGYSTNPPIPTLKHN